MTVLSAQTIRRLGIISENFCEPTQGEGRISQGLSACGYDIRCAENVEIPSHRNNWDVPFRLASAVEKFKMPNNVVGIVHDKSTWARRGLAVQNTVIEPGWCGFLTIELSNHSDNAIYVRKGQGIAQVVFHFLDEETKLPYVGKYQNQEAGPQEAR